MPSFYKFKNGGYFSSFDDTFVPFDAFSQGLTWYWGSSESGLLFGVGSAVSSPTLISNTSQNWKQLSAGTQNSAGIKMDGSLWVAGRNNFGQLGLGGGAPASVSNFTQLGGNDWSQVACGSFHMAAVKSDGSLYTWGRNNRGQLGDGTTTDRNVPTIVSPSPAYYTQVSCGSLHTAALNFNNSPSLYTWGDNTFGQLGNGQTSTIPVSVPTGVVGAVKQVSCGSFYTGYVNTNGTISLFGFNDFSQLGDGTVVLKCSPVTLTGNTWAQIACGGRHTAAIKTDGSLWAWGRNDYGQLGNGTISTNPAFISSPTPISSSNTYWKQVSCGYLHTAAVQTDFSLWTWGYQDYGELGNGVISGTGQPSPSPTLRNTSDWKQVSCGYKHTIAINYINSYQ